MEERRVLGGALSRGFSKDLLIRGWQPWYCITQCWKTHPAAPEGQGAATCLKYPHQPCAEVGWGPGLAQQHLAAFLSHPQLLPPQPWALNQESCTRWSCSCVQAALTMPLPSWEGFTLCPLTAQREGESKPGHLEGKKLLNVTWLQWGWWSVALPGLSCMADSCSEQSQGG